MLQISFREHTLDTVCLLNLLGALKSLLVAVVPDGDVGTGLGETLGNSETNTGAGTRDNGGLALEGEKRHKTVILGGDGVVVGEVTLLGDGFVRHGCGNGSELI